MNTLASLRYIEYIESMSMRQIIWIEHNIRQGASDIIYVILLLINYRAYNIEHEPFSAISIRYPLVDYLLNQTEML